MGRIGKEKRVFEIPEPVTMPDTVPEPVPEKRVEEPVPA